MKSFMVPAEHHAAMQRVLLLGRSGDAAALLELIALSNLPSNEVQRLAGAAIGKLAGAAHRRMADPARHPLSL